MTNKERYEDFCRNSGVYVSIFSQPWWLEAVSGGNWDVLFAENPEIMACNPYYYEYHENGMIIRKAPLTQNNGVIFDYPKNMKYVKKLSFERKALEMIIDQIEAMDLASYRQYFHYSFTNWLPYYWRGFSESTRYTYVIEQDSMEGVVAEMDTKLRNQIRKAASIVEVREGMDIAEFYEFNKKTFQRQDMEIPYSFEIVKRINEECEKRNLCRTLYAVDRNGTIHSAIYLIEDDHSVYYFLSGSDPEYRDSQALSLLLEKGIEYAVSIHKSFDFEGSIKRNIEKSVSQYGGVQKAYMDIRKEYKNC